MIERAYMSVKLVGVTSPMPMMELVEDCNAIEAIVALAAAKSHRAKPSKRLIQKCIMMGHDSVLEHVSFTFDVQNVSRALLAQLTRHRIASYTVESQRYVDYTKKPLRYILPKSIERTQAQKDFEQFMESCAQMYKDLVEIGVKPEDARFVLPQAITCDLVFSMNARELRHACDVRIDSHAQWEIQALFKRCLWQAASAAPALFLDKVDKFQEELKEFIV